jgi:hypothetical protein
LDDLKQSAQAKPHVGVSSNGPLRFSIIFEGNVPELSANKGLTYDLVYNLVHGRIRSLSVGDYRAIFGVDPPRHAQKRVNARYFRGMVRLRLFLNNKDTRRIFIWASSRD